MPELTDHELLADFARSESEAAFATLVTRYVNLVYSAALRFTANSHHAEEITQAVFIILAQKAAKLSSKVVLSGWLYQTTRLTAANFMKAEIRRQRREQEAYMQSTLNDPDSAAWQQIAPLLEDAMGRLGETDRNAVVLRFFENKTAAQVASTLNLSEAAAHKRTSRALDKLRKFFSKHGVSSTTSIIAGAISAHSIQTAPAALAKFVTTVAAAKGIAASGSILTLVKGAMKLMAWTKAQTAVVSLGVLAIASTTTIVVKNNYFPSEPSYEGKRLSEWLVDVDYGQPPEKRAKAGEAIRKMGTKTLPFLIADLTPNTKGTDNRYRQATWAFDALGPIGKPAIPKLTRLLEGNPGYVPSALAGIGRDALPELLSSLTNRDFFIRDNTAAAIANAIFSGKIKPEEADAAFPVALDNLTYTDANELYQANTRSRAAWLLAALKQQPEITVPALIQGLRDSNMTDAADCAFALSQFGKDAKVAIPELTAAANSTNNQLSTAAKQSLGAIQNAP